MTTPSDILGNRVRDLKIAEDTYQIHVLPAGEGFVMANKIMKVIAPAIATLAATEGDLKGLDFSNIASQLMENMDKLDVEAILYRLLKDITVNNAELDFDTHFTCNYGVLLDLIVFALTENFQSFFQSSVSLFPTV